MGDEKFKIGVLADTHLSGYDEKLKKIVNGYFADVDLIIHAGDLVDLRVLEIFADKEVKAVCGNMDYFSVKEKLPDRLFLEIRGFKLGVIHGWGEPAGIEDKIKDRLGRLDRLDCIIFGHTHCPANHFSDGVLFFNPGSPTEKRLAAHRSIGILEIDKEVRGRIINL
jgi:uncharacterized protein